MANKEERIEISTYDLNNKEWNGDIPIDILKVYTRQEAIEVMAKGMCKRATEVIKNNETVVFNYGFYAEAALNALLAEALNVKDDE